MKVIKELDEFTWDMVRGLPHANFLHVNNITFKVICKVGLKSLYLPYTPNIEELEEFTEKSDNSTYEHSAPEFTKSEWLPPYLRNTYPNSIIESDKPVLIIQNKFTTEWGGGPYNFIDIPTLKKIFDLTLDKFTIIYFRPDGNGKGYFKDKNKVVTFNDYDFIRSNYSEVILFTDLLKKFPEYSYNTLQFSVSSSSNYFISVSGGNACISSYFGKDVIIFDSPKGAGAGRGVWKTDSWLKLLGGASVYGVNDYEELISKVKELWIS